MTLGNRPPWRMVGFTLSNRYFSRMENETDERPPSDAEWQAIVEWAEKSGIENLKARYATSELLAKDAQSLLTVILAGVGGSLAFGLRVFDTWPPKASDVGAAVVCLYLICVGARLVHQGMKFKPYPSVHQSPENLVNDDNRGFSLHEMRLAELGNITERIDKATEINDGRAKLLNSVKTMALLTPLVFLVTVVGYVIIDRYGSQQHSTTKPTTSANSPTGPGLSPPKSLP